MSEMILELEGFPSRTRGGFVVKEMAYFDFYMGYHARWSFRPPCSWRLLSSAEKKSCAWLTDKRHGLTWSSGDLPYSSLETIVASLTATYPTIYTKGREKTLFLERLCGKTIHDLNHYQCPAPEFLKNGSGDCEVRCPDHEALFERCALHKAYLYGRYMKDRGSADPETLPAADPRTLPAADPRTLPAADPETLPAADPRTLPDADSWTLPDADPRTLPDADSWTLPDADQRILPAADPRTLSDANPRTLSDADPRTLPDADPRTLPDADPRILPAADPRNKRAADPKNKRAADPRNRHSAGPRNRHSAGPRNRHAAEPRNRHAAEPRNRHAAEPRNRDDAVPCQTKISFPMQNMEVTVSFENLRL